MDPHSGRIYDLGRDLTGDVEVGQLMDVSRLRREVEALGDHATADERAAALEARALVAVSAEAAQLGRLGERELERRRRRRTAAKQARKANR